MPQPTQRPRARCVDAQLIDAESMPWIPFEPHSPDLLVKYFRLDPARDETVMLLRAPAGASLPRMQASGRMMLHTLEGRWQHREGDWIAGPGSVLFAPAASGDGLAFVAGDAPVLALAVVVGDLRFLGERGEVLAIENWQSAQARYLAHCARSSILPREQTQATERSAA
jgi:2,4'-dihydroxyacetophenone dioxygenase